MNLMERSTLLLEAIQPFLKWSRLESMASEEDCDAKDKTQASRDRGEAASG